MEQFKLTGYIKQFISEKMKKELLRQTDQDTMAEEWKQKHLKLSCLDLLSNNYKNQYSNCLC